MPERKSPKQGHYEKEAIEELDRMHAAIIAGNYDIARMHHSMADSLMDKIRQTAQSRINSV